MSNPYYSSAHWRALREQCLRRDGYRCVVCGAIACIVDHVVTRPSDAVESTAYDVLENLRSLCKQHDAQVKERGPRRVRKQGGHFTIRGCSADGIPVDPRHPWRQEQ